MTRASRLPICCRAGDGTAAGRSAALEIDPVCGMEVDPKAAEAAWEYEGVTYYFCSRGCLIDFREDPGSYLS
jgi:P-type Cu+ transporter